MENGIKVEGIKGIVFDIQRFSVHDGYGIRTLVFLKGCPLRCRWCSNPESQDSNPQIAFFKEKCSFCQRCVSGCPIGLTFKESGKIDWSKCQKCLKCVDACVYNARVAYGKMMTVDKVVEIVKRDIPFYKKSAGGMTLGGGEATFQPEFARQILKKCHEVGIHTAMETCGFVSWKVFEKIIRHVDQLLYDIKHMDTKKHKEFTGVDNKIILQNAVMASERVKEMIVRFPLIPDFNDDRKNIEELACFIKKNMPLVKKIDVLPYHSTGESKCKTIGREYTFRHEHEVNDEKIEECKKILTAAGLQVSIGG